jgi:hypothetical protein
MENVNLAYNTILCERNIRSADQIIDRWAYDRKKLYKDSFNNMWREYILSIDHKCDCNVGILKHPLMARSICSGCDILSRLFFDAELQINKEFEIYVGKYTSSKYIIQSYKLYRNEKDTYVVTSDPVHSINVLIEQINNLKLCEKTFETQMINTIFMKSLQSKEEHTFVISSIMERIMLKNKMKNIPSYSWMFKCKDTINIVSKIYPTLSSVINEIKIKKILKQLINILYTLSKNNFIHGDLTIDKLFVNDDTLIINPSVYSSISITNKNEELIRFYHPGNNYEQVFENLSFPTIKKNSFIGYKSYSEMQCVDGLTADTEITCYNFKKFNILLSYVRFLGIPIFQSSLDFYTIMISLMCNSTFNILISNSRKMYRLWTDLWSSDDLDIINESVKKINNPTTDMIIHLMADKNLRCDALKNAYHYMFH